MGEPKEYLFKVLVIGDIGTGKTSIIKRYVHNYFSAHYRATIGVDFAMKVLNWKGNAVVRLQLWDIAGQERFGNMTRVYYKEAAAAFVVFDLTRAGTFDGVAKWKMDLDQKVQLANGQPIPAVLLANKSDLEESNGIGAHDLDEYCREYGFCGWFKTSAKEGEGINEAAETLISNVIAVEESGQYEIPVMARDGEVRRLVDPQNQPTKPSKPKSGCDC